MAKKKRKLGIVQENENQTSTETINTSNETLNTSDHSIKSENFEEDTFTPKVEEKKSEVIDLNEKGDVQQKAVVDFTDQKFIDDLVSKKTKKVEEPEKENEFKTKSKEEIADAIRSAENSGNDMSPEDIYNVAEIIITILDTFLANAMRIYAKDTSDSAYSLNDKKRKHLVKLLASILVKYQAKLKTEFIFLFALILYYAAPVLAARQRRKDIKLYNEQMAMQNSMNPDQNQNVQNTQNSQSDVIEPEVFEDKKEEVFYPEVIPEKFKKKRGRPTSF